MVYDLKLALRTLLKKPAFSLMAIGMLALGIACNAAIFSIFNGLFLKPLPVPDSGQLVDLDETAPKWNLQYVSIAYPDFYAWRKESRAFESMAVYRQQSFNLSGRGEAQRIRGASMTYDFATVLKVKPVLGRDFTPEDDRPGTARVAILSHGLWQRQYGSDPKVLGRIVKLDGEAHTIVGVLPREAVLPHGAEIWTPLAADPTDQRRGWYLQGIGRLKKGINIEQARADLLRIHRNQVAAGRKVNEITSPVVTPLRERFLGEFRTGTTVLLGAVGIVLLIACVNVAGLMLVRGAARSREIAIRTAIGASRTQLVRQLFAECLLLALAGGSLGIVLGIVLHKGLLSLLPDVLPLWALTGMDFRFVAFCLAITCAAAILFGLAPALHASRTDVRESLQDAAPRSGLSRGRHRSLTALVVGEVALAVVMLVGAGLLIQAFRRVLHVDPGYRTQNVLTFSVSLPQAGYDKPERRLQFYERLNEKLRATAGVMGAAACSTPPLDGHWGMFFEVEGARPLGPNEQDPVILQRVSTPGYLEAIGIALVRGRSFTDRDGAEGAPKVIIVNETFAKRFWPNVDPLGKRVRSRGAKDWSEVIGVTRDIKHYGLDRDMRPGVYLPHRQAPVGGMIEIVRTANDPQALVAAVRSILRELDPDIPMSDVLTMSERMDRSLWARRAASWLMGAFAVVALLLAAAGLYGVISYAVAQRTHEFGIRMALGAQPGQVMADVLRHGAVLIGAGVAIGLGVSLWAAGLLRTMLFGLNARDPLTYTVVVLALVCVALAANAIPARRAAAVDPMRALRFE